MFFISFCQKKLTVIQVTMLMLSRECTFAIRSNCQRQKNHIFPSTVVWISHQPRNISGDEKHAPVKRTSNFKFDFYLRHSLTLFLFFHSRKRAPKNIIQNSLSIIFRVLWKCLWYLIYWNLHNSISEFMVFMCWLRMCENLKNFVLMSFMLMRKQKSVRKDFS